MKKIIAFMGSPRKKGNSAAMLERVAVGAREGGAEFKIYSLNDMKVRPCQACMLCRGKYACSLKDDMQAVYADLKDASAVVLASPVYMFGITAQVKLLLDRLFPLLDGNFAPRLGQKRSLLIFSQGNTDPDMFSGDKPDGASSCFKEIGKLFAFFGLVPAQAHIVVAGANDPSCAASNKELLDAAYAAGKNLAALD